MIKSMTGFASLTRDDERGAIGVTIRSVNHRFLDLQVRLPAAIADVEPRIRAMVPKHVARGRVEVTVSLQLRQAAAPQVELNGEFAHALASVVEQARKGGWVTGDLTPGDLLRIPQALTIRERDQKLNRAWISIVRPARPSCASPKCSSRMSAWMFLRLIWLNRL